MHAGALLQSVPMRRLLAAAVLAAGLAGFLPSDAAASEAPPVSEALEPGTGTRPFDGGPTENPEDWVVAAGLVCYVVLPLLALVATGVFVYRTFVRESAGSLVLPAERTAWVARGAAARAPPGIALLRF